jgi:YgiT-type zinc finger domain-containing protein
MGRSAHAEEKTMKCRNCGGALHALTTDLPLKITAKTIVIIKDVPVLQCERCSEYLLADDTVAKVDSILSGVAANAELEIVRFAA